MLLRCLASSPHTSVTSQAASLQFVHNATVYVFNDFSTISGVPSVSANSGALLAEIGKHPSYLKCKADLIYYCINAKILFNPYSVKCESEINYK